MSFYDRFYKIFSSFVRHLYRIEVAGLENLPAEGAILAANHTSFSDPIVLSAAAGGRQVRYMAKKELFHTPLAPLIKALGAYPVDRGGSDVTSIRRTISLVGEGELVGIFPQGHRYPGKDPRETPIKPGVGMIAYHTRAAVVPVCIRNRGRRTRAFCRNTVVFGKPIPPEAFDWEGGSRNAYRKASEAIFGCVCDLLEGADEKGGEGRA
ncbi:MAG: 1-acyl-sn-glycerol-3-phosphate acyltransferase [Clostridia bacterium]|nr:1-acyl-sn-glycerol-3-phosphate acyltransferase [Clostridia bacterium]